MISQITYLKSAVLWLALAACLFPLPAPAAGWSTNVWPAWQHPRDVRQQLDDCRSALEERRWAILNITTAPGLDGNIYWTNDYRRFRDNADIIRSSIDAFYDNSSAYALETNAAVGGTYDAWLLTNSTLPMLSLATTCAQLGFPTNILTVYEGPFRVELSGLGGYTNDAAVIGHAHGYTNEFTVLGGTNFPAGRTRWYTTDYNMDNLKALIQQIQWTADSVDALTYVASSDYRNAAPAHDDDWAEAKTWAEASEVATGDSFLGVGTRGAYYASPLQWFAYYCAHTWTYAITGIRTNVSKTVDVYQYAENMGLTVDGNDVFDDQGFPVREDVYTKFWSTNMTYSAGVTSSVQGLLTFPGTWCDSPDATNDYRTCGFSIGYSLNETKAVVKWQFQYQ